jgi:hypothetical protein
MTYDELIALKSACITKQEYYKERLKVAHEIQDFSPESVSFWTERILLLEQAEEELSKLFYSQNVTA